MKLADVKIGETYRTKIGSNLVKVVVMHAVLSDGVRTKRTRFCVRRVDNNKVLAKYRDPSALHPLLRAAPESAPESAIEK